jgi:predicted porin
MTIGYKNLLSKRSQVYIAYSKLDNKADAAYVLTPLYSYTLGNQDATALSVGMKHDF